MSFFQFRGLMACGIFLSAVLAMVPAFAASGAELSAEYCRRSRNDAEARPVPESLAPLVAKAFGLDEQVIRNASYYRCADGRLLACAIGANLPCGKGNVSRRILGADEFCRQNPGSNFIPMSITGHDTIYAWRCAGKAAAPGRPVERLDRQGFIMRYWRRL
jgi:hypothetical protein